MYISSTLSQQAASGSQPRCSYVVLHYGDDHVLVPLQRDVCGHYEAVVLSVKEEWDLEGDELIFETKELDVCPGVCVKIRKECFAAGILNDIGNVYVSRRISSDFGSNKTVKGQPITRAHVNKSASINQPDYVVVSAKSDYDSDETESTATGFQTADEGAASLREESSTTTRALKNSQLSSEPSQTPQSSQKSAGLSKKNGSEDVFGSSQTPSQNADSADMESGRFVVCIHDGVEENSAAFRVAPDQTVLRVLKGACKHFGLDFTQSMLYREVTSEGRPQRLKCEQSATMKSLDVQEYQQFVVGPIQCMISR